MHPVSIIKRVPNIKVTEIVCCGRPLSMFLSSRTQHTSPARETMANIFSDGGPPGACLLIAEIILSLIMFASIASIKNYSDSGPLSFTVGVGAVLFCTSVAALIMNTYFSKWRERIPSRIEIGYYAVSSFFCFVGAWPRPWSGLARPRSLAIVCCSCSARATRAGERASEREVRLALGS